MSNITKCVLLCFPLVLNSCSNFIKPLENTKNTVNQEIQVTPEEKNNTSLNTQGVLVGAAQIEAPSSHERRTYFLYGAEHLSLENYYFDIPVVYNDAVKKWISYFTGRGRGFLERYLARAGRYAPLMGEILETQNLPRDLIFLAMAESGFQTKAKSWAKAVGPWQFMPFTGKRYGLKIDWYVDERRDPIKATLAAAKYLNKLYEEFGSWELAAAGYNAGEGKISRAIRRYKTENFWNLRKGRYLKSETKNYVPKIMALAIIGKNLKSFGFEEVEFFEPHDFEEIEVPAMTDLMALSENMEVPFEEIQRLNPEILRWFTPPNTSSYHLRVPIGLKEEWKIPDLNKFKADSFMTYSLKSRRSTLKDVAKKYRIKDLEVLKRLNPQISWRKSLAKGTLISLPFKIGQNLKDNMYADLYEKPRKSVLKRRMYRKRIQLAKRRGKRITNPSGYYTVSRGDSLWSVARKNGISLDTLIVSNLNIIARRQIRAGDRLVVR